MAQTGYTPISIYYSSTATNVPTAGNLVAGELAINTADGKLFYKDSAGVVQVIGTKGGVGSSTTTQVLYNSSGLVVGSANLTFDGTTLTANALKSATLGSPSATALTLQSAGTTAVTLATDQTATFAGNAVFANNNYTGFKNTSGSATCSIFQDTSNDFWMYNGGATNTRFYTNATERMRIDSSGNLLVGTTSNLSVASKFQVSSSASIAYLYTSSTASDGCYVDIAGNNKFFEFRKAGVEKGSISTNGTTVSYNISSDYRLKDNVTPMQNALATVSALKPCTYKWKSDGSDGQGFIAHELQEVVPDCVTGEKDAVDADGKPKYQGIDTSFLVATLTAAIQELNAKVDAQAVEIATLKAK
jgi:hypothetical protein